MSETNNLIAVIGRGQVGSALGRVLAASGLNVVYGVKAPSSPDELGVADACSAAGKIVLAVPWGAIDAVIADAGPLDGKIVIDGTNPLAMKDGRLGLALETGSGAERIAALAPGASVFKTFNQTGAENMAAARRYGAPPVMFVAGDDAAAMPSVLALVEQSGFDAVDAGPLSNARLLESLAMLWIDQALVRGQGRDFAFTRIRPTQSQEAK